MIYLQSTKKTLSRLGLGREKLAGPGSTDAVLGNWFVNIVPMGGREAFLFMSTRSLLSFPIMIGKLKPGPKNMPSFVQHGVTLLLQSMKVPRAQSKRLLQDLNEIVICTNTDKSLIGVHNAIAAQYFQAMASQGDHLAVIERANATPRATLGWFTSLEVTSHLLAASVA
jgi:hypothetical protein